MALGPGLDSETLRKGLEALAGREDMQALVAFGSRACVGGRPDSDLDLLVIGREARIEPEEQIQRRQELRTALGDVGVPVDLLVYGQEEAGWLSGSAGMCSAMRHAAGRFCMSPSEDAALLLGLQPFAVKARYSAEDTPLPGDRLLLLKEIEALTATLGARLLP